jgi:RNA polymerase sigma-54 factor
MKQKFDQKQVQKLALAPALQQAIRLLQLTNLELQEVINQELEENPLLELEDEAAAEVPGETQAVEVAKSEDELASDGNRPDEFDDIIFAAGFQDYFDEEIPYSRPGDQEKIPFENLVSKRPSLWDHLNWQASLTFFEPSEVAVAEFIIGNINEDGYLTLKPEEIAARLEESIEKVEAVREKIKMFDPPGCGSLTLTEALLAQMDSLNLQDEVARKIVSDYLSYLEKSDHQELARLLNLTFSELKLHVDLIKNLDPAPGRKYSEEKDIYVVPDIYVMKEEGEWKVYLNEEALPKLRLNRYYKQLTQAGLKEDQETTKFLKDKMKRALWFLRSLDQRNRTIYRVARYIVDRQQEFLEKGIDCLRPMTLLEVARELGLHESTIGRVVANKYMMTPLGLYPLKFFFHKSLSGTYGQEVSSIRIKERVRKLIENEDRQSPLSDDEIVDILSRENIQIARRTVAKYRGQLNIPPSHIRKKKFMMEGIT